MMQNITNKITRDNTKLYDILQESVSLGLGRAASVIGELVDSHVVLSTANVYTVDKHNEIPVFSKKLISMMVEGEILNGKKVFSMNNDQLMKMIKYLEGFDELDMEDDEVIEIILDTY